MTLTSLHPGRVVCKRSRQDKGEVVVVDDGAIRTLHFNTRLPQSRMDLNDPGRLVSQYAKMMMAILPYPDQLKRVLLIGLGGGGLVRFLAHHFPDCRLEVVEPDALVVEVAREFFFPAPWIFPQIHLQDGLNFIHTASLESCYNYDLIIVDAYNGGGMSRSVHSQSFFDGCVRRLSHNGGVVVNLATSIGSHYNVAMVELGRAFQGGLLTLPVAGTGNVVAMGGKPSLLARSEDQVAERASLLHKKLQLPLADYRGALISPKVGGWEKFWHWPW